MYDDRYVKKIRQSLKRGHMLYKINQSKDNTQSLDITHIENKANKENNINSINILNTSNNTIMTDQAIVDDAIVDDAIVDHEPNHKEDHDGADDLNIIPLNTWSNMKMSEVQPSNDSSFISMSSMNLHKYDNSSVDTSIMRDSCITSNTMKYGQPNSKPQFQRQLMINRLRRKRKYDHISNDINHQKNNDQDIDCIFDNVEPPKKKTNAKDIDLMSSRDLKNEIKRIHRTKGNNALLTRKNLLLRKSVQKISSIANNKSIHSKNRLKTVIKKVFKLS